MRDSAGGVEIDYSAGGGRCALLYDQNGSSRTVCPIGVPTSGLPIPLSVGGWHTFQPNQTMVVMYSARYFIDPTTLLGAAPLASSTANSRFALGDINNLGRADGSKYVPAQGFGLAGSSFHTAIGEYNSTNTWKKDSYFQDTAPGATVEPDLINYPPDMIGSTTQVWLRHIGFKFAYDGFYPYRSAPSLVQRDITTVAIYDPVGLVKRYIVYDTNTWKVIIEAMSTPNDGFVSPITPSPCVRITNLALYGYAAFQFSSGLPNDYLVAIQWMAQRWAQGERLVYPKWMGLS